MRRMNAVRQRNIAVRRGWRCWQSPTAPERREDGEAAALGSREGPPQWGSDYPH
jgi:hypothetical protein